MTQCQRCGNWLKPSDTREVKDGKVYHLWCWFKLEQQEKEQHVPKTA